MRTRTFTLLLLILAFLWAGTSSSTAQNTPTKKTAKVKVTTTVKDDDSTSTEAREARKVKVVIRRDAHGGETVNVEGIDEDELEDLKGLDDVDEEDGETHVTIRRLGVPIPPSFPPGRLLDLKELGISLENDSPYVQVYRDVFRNFDEQRSLQEDLNFYRNFDSEAYKQFKEISKLEKKTFEIARQYRKTTEAVEKKKIEAELETTLQQLFDLREQRKELEISRLEADLQRTKEKFNERKANRGPIIKKRLDQLLEKSDGLEW